MSWGFYYVFIVKTSFGIIGILFGSFGLRTNVKAIQRYRNGYKVKNRWLMIHISGMIGGYIATATAFLVNVIHFQPAFVLWLTPSVIFVPVIFYTIRKFRKKVKSGTQVEELVTIKIDQ